MLGRGRAWRSRLQLVVVTLALAIGGLRGFAHADGQDQELEKYRAMISDPFSNPGTLNVDRGEAFWTIFAVGT